MGLSQWALRKLACSDFASITDIGPLEMQVQAVSRLAGLSYEEGSAAIERAWAQSVAGTNSNSSPGHASAEFLAGTPEGVG